MSEKYTLNSSRRQFKGQAETLLFTLMAALVIVAIFFIAYVYVNILSLSVENKLFVQIEIDESGGALANFLEANRLGKSYMEMMGLSYVKNINLISETEKIKGTLDSLGKTCVSVFKQAGTQPLKQIGDCVSALQTSDKQIVFSESEIPLPGAVTGRTKGLVRLYEE